MPSLRDLAACIDRRSASEGIVGTELPRLSLYRISRPHAPLHVVYEPTICVVAQGRKQAIHGRRRYVYDTDHCLIVSVDMPLRSQVLEASPHRPFLAALLSLDIATVNDLAMDADPAAEASEPMAAIALSVMDADLLDAWVRLLRTLDAPRDQRILAPLVERELLYRLLQGPQGAHIGALARARHPIYRAIGAIRREYREALRVEDLIGETHLSRSTFHRQFKAVTGMSPLQYQKHLRLREARRLMLTESLQASDAGFEVGYESASQFSREYRRLFGAPPARDVAAVREQRDSVLVLSSSRVA